MSIQVSFEFETTQAAAAFLHKLSITPVTEHKPGASSAPPTKKGRPSKAMRDVKLSAPVDQVAQPAPQILTKAELSELEAQHALEEVFHAKGMPVAKDLLSRYGVKRLGELKRDSYAEFIGHAKRVLTGEPV